MQLITGPVFNTFASFPAFKREAAQREMIGGELGADFHRIPSTRPHPSALQSSLLSRSLSKLESLKRKRFEPSERVFRIEKSLAALNTQANIKLEAAEWQWIAEDDDLEDQTD